MSVSETARTSTTDSALGGRRRDRDGGQSYELWLPVGDGRGPQGPADLDAVRASSPVVTPFPRGVIPCRPGVTRPLAFFIGRGSKRTVLDVGEPGFIRRR